LPNSVQQKTRGACATTRVLLTGILPLSTCSISPVLPPAHPDFRAQGRSSGKPRTRGGRRMRSNRVDARAGLRTHRSLTVSRSHSEAVVSMSASAPFQSRADDLRDSSIYRPSGIMPRSRRASSAGFDQRTWEYCDPVNLSRLHLAGVNRQVISAAGAC
jgi:hypothetical protein